MMTLKFTDQVPFKKVYIHGLIRDAQGQKMSKSKGNVLDPIDLIDGIGLEDLVAKRTEGLMQPQLEQKIEKSTRAEFPEGITGYGTDALRYTYYSLASTGRDIKFDLGRMEGFRNFCNKIWNASRYVIMNTEEKGLQFTAADVASLKHDIHLSLADRWILSRLQQTVAQVHEHMSSFRFDLMSQVIYDFFWNEYCDWYVELSKPVLWDADNQPKKARAARLTLLTVLESSLRMLHPLMPFITEEIWQKIATLIGTETASTSIMLQAYPQVDTSLINTTVDSDIEWVKGVIIGVRNIRGEMNIPPGKTFPALLRKTGAEDRRRLHDNLQNLLKLAKLSELRCLADDETAPVSATQLYQDMEILVPLSDLIDKNAEISRLEKEIAKLDKNLQGINGKLSNEKFVQNAPVELVDQERERQRSAQAAIDALNEKLAAIKAL
jgi:valyl-tRNA synthetase